MNCYHVLRHCFISKLCSHIVPSREQGIIRGAH